jgi:acyl-CoA reductase-like NAD-dependent aldehyde dehydrogenase
MYTLSAEKEQRATDNQQYASLEKRQEKNPLGRCLLDVPWNFPEEGETLYEGID